jgi:hypothetical protein
MASAELGHERLAASDPLAEYFQGYMPGRVHGLAVAAVRSAMWTAFFLRGVRPDRKMALDTMANQRWATLALGDLFVRTDGDDEQGHGRLPVSPQVTPTWYGSSRPRKMSMPSAWATDR